jgi:predicted SprT family Zn-dependent metalloprotease
MGMMMKAPTNEAYGELQGAYDFYNIRLFKAQLPNCLITLQRKNKRVHGYFWQNKFKKKSGLITDELAMNPMHFRNRTIEDVLATFVHEMVHVWQHHQGKAGRGKYHNREWGAKMKEVGLYPSNTARVGGKETGDQMMHYIIRKGNFERCTEELLAKGFDLSWGEGDLKIIKTDEPGIAIEPLIKEKDKSNRDRYNCPKCDDRAWGKPTLKLICGKCQVNFTKYNASKE